MKEEILQHFWNAKSAVVKPLKTENNLPIIVRNFGLLNEGQGPDFTEAEVEIDGIIFHGAIEIHVDSKNWFDHQHHLDEKYTQVVLHVVWEFKQDVYDLNQRIIPTLALKNFFSLKDLQISQNHFHQNGEFPCHYFHEKVLVSEKYQQLVFAQSKRWQRKVDEVLLKHFEYKGNWQQVILFQFAKYWMDQQNRQSMLQLVSKVDVFRLQKMTEPELCAFWIGQSGLPIDHLFEKDFSHKLWTNFLFLKHKFQLKEHQLRWYFGKVRPNAFPDLRILQWSNWLSKQQCNLTQWLKPFEYHELIDKLTVAVTIQNSLSSNHENNSNGIQHVNQLIINAVVPIWMAYGTYHGNQSLIEHAMYILEQVPPENNKIVKKMDWLNIFNRSAKHSQQLIAQNEIFCKQKKCMECLIGQSYLSHGKMS